MNKKVIIPIGLLLLAAVSYRTGQYQIEDIQKDFQRSFDKALEERSVGFVESARERISAEKTRLWNAIQEDVEVELTILGVNVPWTMTLPSLSMGVECVCVNRRRGMTLTPFC